jgi:Ser/Thr protein kinase RdoA (MazF antagonist)
MMNVQHMRWIVDVTAAGGLPHAVREAARRWNADSVIHVRSSGNHVFRIVLPSGAIGYLRLTPAAQRSHAALQAELEFVHHVADSGLVVATPIPSEAGAFIEAIDDPESSVSEARRHYAIVFSGLHGRQMEHDEMQEAYYRAWGRALAQLHRASQTFSYHSARPSWSDEIRQARSRLPASEGLVAHVLDAGASWLATMPVQPGEYGLIHGDSELDNLIWDDQQPQVLDFDSAVYAPYLVDIAIALQEVWSAETPDRDDHVAWFCDGYRELRPLQSGALESLPRLLTLLAAFKVAQLLDAYAPATTEEQAGTTAEPPWLVRMRTRHQRWLDSQRATLVWR